MALAGGGPFGQPTMVPLYQPTPAAAAAGATSMAQPARLAMTVLPGSRVATIRFADGSARISGDERASLEQAAQLAQSRNARLKVVGYASAGGRQAGLERLKLANFNMSMDRAEAVARELVRLGVNPALIVVEAKPDAAAGADGTKAEIYLEN